MAPLGRLSRAAGCWLALLVAAAKADDEAPSEVGMTLEQVKALHPKLDLDGDGKISAGELEQTGLKFRLAQARLQMTHSWQFFDEDKDGKITKKEFMAQVGDNGEDSGGDSRHGIDAAHSEELFAAADVDGDGSLTKEEFLHIYSQETTPAMMKIAGREALVQFDEDKDGSVSLEEFAKMQGSELEQADDAEKEYMKDKFKKLDANGDGKLDAEEMVHLSTGKHHVDNEMEILLKSSDTDGDGHISPAELETAHPHFRDATSGHILLNWAEHMEL